MVRMVFSGLLDRYPKLKIITHHLGGMIPYYDGRVGPGLKVLGQRTSDEDYSKILPSLKRPHMDYLHDFYADTAMFGGGVAATRCGLDFFGADQVVFATDTPLGPIAPTIATGEKAGARSDGRAKAFFRQCRKTAEDAVRLTGICLLLVFDIGRAGHAGKTWRVARGKLSSELFATSSSLLLSRSRSSSMLSRTDLLRLSARRCRNWSSFSPPQRSADKVPRPCEIMCR